MRNLAVILLKSLVIFPNQEIKIELNNDLSKKTINEAILNNNAKILVIAPLDSLEEELGVDDLPKVGVIANIKNKIVLENKAVRITLRGIKRVAVAKYFNKKSSEILYSEVLNIDLPEFNKLEEKAVRRKLINILKEYIDSSKDISNSILTTIEQVYDLDKFTDIITSFLPFDVDKKLAYMQNINPLNRAKDLITDLLEELKCLQVEEELNESTSKILESSQKEFILKEKLKAIKKELGEDSLKDEEVQRFKNALAKLNIAVKTKEKLNNEIEKFLLMNEMSPEISVLRNYLDWTIFLPWQKMTKDETNLDLVIAKLDATHYGLAEIKERIVEYLAMKKLNPQIKSPIICLVGPPGVGKTSIAISIAEALKRKFYKINVGGLNDSTELIGSRRTYLAANPGKIIQGIKKCNSKNPVILIDEVDKMIRDYKGDPSSTLLEILDPVQNKYFTDNYIEEPFDLSKVLFILTANNKYDIPPVLLDRMELFELNSYTYYEKTMIAQNYLLPNIFKEYGLKENQIKFKEEILEYIINNYTSEGGVRELHRVLSSLIRKLTINNIKTINQEKIVKFLGNPKYESEDYPLNNLSGVVNTLAVTSSGGIVTQLEVTKYKGTGKVIITGLVEKIMTESIEVALSYVKHNYNHLFNNNDLHFHFLNSCLKKDGPSAGVSITTALLSLIEKKKIPKDLAFTGEISLNGAILRIGNLKEKIIGAYNKNIKKIYIPQSNEPDLKEVPAKVLANIEVKFVTKYDEIYDDLFKKSVKS